jgi:hypothetical protein
MNASPVQVVDGQHDRPYPAAHDRRETSELRDSRFSMPTSPNSNTGRIPRSQPRVLKMTV